MSEGTKRRLAAIVSADVVGYSRLMGADEAGTLDRLKAHRAELIDDLVDKHGGRIVKTTGDGLLLEFSSVVAAVECAAAVQDGLVERNAGKDPDQAIRLRIGVHLGDVIIDGEDIYGEGVNIAARLQEIGEADRICISDAVHAQVNGKVHVTFEDGGEPTLKNIAAPVRVWHSTRAQEVVTKTMASTRPAVAVLPFANMSNDPDQEYFADGITEDLITALSYQKLFPVIARNTVYVYKGRSVGVGQIGQELNAGYVVEGSVRRAGQRVRISAQLIEVATDHHVWAQKYDRDLGDIFDLQDEITDALVRNIAPELIAFERQKTRAKNPRDMAAYDLYLRALSNMHVGTAAAIVEAEDMARQAIARDATFGPAHSLLGFIITYQYFRHSERRSRSRQEEATREAKLAVELDDRDATAWAIWGMHSCFKGNHEQAIEASERAVSLNPYAFQPRLSLGNAFFFDGQLEAAVSQYQEALRISGGEDDLIQITNMMAWSEYVMGNYDEACIWGRKAAALATDYFQVNVVLAATYAQLGEDERAREHMVIVYRHYPGLNAARYRRNIRWRDARMIDQIVEGLRKAGLPE